LELFGSFDGPELVNSENSRVARIAECGLGKLCRYRPRNSEIAEIVRAKPKKSRCNRCERGKGVDSY